MGSQSRRLRKSVARRQGAVCARCGALTNLTLDHIIPKSRGGSNRIENLQLLCFDCNQRKGNTVDEVEAMIARVRRPRFVRGRSKRARQVGLVGPHLPGCDFEYCMHDCPTRGASA